MKKVILWVVLVCIFLGGCSKKSDVPSSQTEATEAIQTEIPSQNEKPEVTEVIQPEKPSEPEPVWLFQVTNPRMNGEDVLKLQKRLLSLGFTKVGEADGYYGPLTADVIKNIQSFSGFAMNGNVTQNLWDYIFSSENASLLQNISTIVTYDPTKLEKSRNLYQTDEPRDGHARAFVYFSHEGNTIKIIEYYSGNIHTQTYQTCYFINDNNYLIKYKYVHPPMDINADPSSTEQEEKVYFVNNNNLYEIVNGTSARSGDGYVIEPINDIMNKFRADSR